MKSRNLRQIREGYGRGNFYQKFLFLVQSPAFGIPILGAKISYFQSRVTLSLSLF
jgi:hypothetical protein